MDNIILQYSPWFIILCLLTGFVYAFALYYKKRKENNTLLFYGLFIARFITVSLISFLLLAPLLKSIAERTVKPILLIAQDYSISLRNAYNNKELREINDKIKEISKKLSRKYEIQEFSLGGDLKNGFSDSFNLKSTNISSLLEYVNDAYDNKELAGVILSSDGIYNEGANPDYFNIRNTAPVYSIALGDTTIKKDALVQNIYHNSIAFAGDRLSVRTDILAKNSAGGKPQLVLSEYGSGGQKIIIEKKTVNINSNDFLSTLDFVIDINEPGVKRFNITVAHLPDEISYKNNSRDFFIEVIDSKTSVLIFANGPHPDISAVKELLSIKKNYSIDIKYTGENADIKKYDIVIFHNLPSTKNDLNTVINSVEISQIPTFFILGSQTNIDKLNKIQNLLKISNFSNSSNDVQAVLNKDFSLFAFEDIPSIGINNFPPLKSPFGNYSISPEARVLFYQRIKNINTTYPLLVLSTSDKNKTAILTASNFFKWKFFEFQQTGNFKTTGSVIDQTVQYLTLKKDKSQWQVRTGSNIFQESENIQFYGELYNDNYQLVNVPEAFLKVTDMNRKEYEFVFSRVENHYEVSTGSFPPGDYEFIASTAIGSKKLTKKGKFTIKTKDLEFYDMIANHGVLSKLSSRSNGEMYFIQNYDKLIKKLLDADIKPVVYSSEHTRHLLDFKLLFFMLLFLLTFEWLVRKLKGSI